MQFQENHEPQMKDMDDFHKPLPKRKFRVIVISFLIIAAAWALFQLLYAIFL